MMRNPLGLGHARSSRARPTLAAGGAMVLSLSLFLSAPGCSRAPGATDPLRVGVEALRAGKFAEAIAAFEGEERGGDPLVRRFNAGVAHLASGNREKALERFEDVASRAEGELKRSAAWNAGYVRFEDGKRAFEAALQAKSDEEKLRGLEEAGKTLRSSAEFFRLVRPEDARTSENLSRVKTALRGVVDEILRLKEEARKKADEEALKSPEKLLRTLIEKERTHRAIARNLARAKGAQVRLGSRSLRKAQAEARALAEKFHHYLARKIEESQTAGAATGTTSPSAGGAPGAPRPMSAEEKARTEQAAASVLRAIEEEKGAEVAYQKLAPLEAVARHTRAIEEFHAALESFLSDLPNLIAEARATQEGVCGALDALEKEAVGGLTSEIRGQGFAKIIAQAVQDEVLAPVAKYLAPRRDEELLALSDDEAEVVWGARRLSQAVIQPTRAEPSGAAPAPPGMPTPPPPSGEAPAIDEATAKDLTENFQRLGSKALEAAEKARAELAGVRLAGAVAPAKEALEALKEAEALLPKPPEPPEKRLEKLIERQEGARRGIDGMSALEREARAEARSALDGLQRADGKEAHEVADELSKREDEPAKQAAGKVSEGEKQVFASAEALKRDRLEEAAASVDRDLVLFREALDLLQGKKDEKKEDEKQQDQGKEPQAEPKPKSEDSKKKDSSQDRYQLTPRDARQERQDMDKKRREEEAKLFQGSSNVTVEKDW